MKRGSSACLTTLSTLKHGFTLHKGAFCDVLHPRYGWTPNLLPTNCVCGSAFKIDHVMNCHRGGFLSICRKDITAELLTEVSYNVQIEPLSQPLTGECFSYRTAVTQMTMLVLILLHLICGLSLIDLSPCQSL